MIYVDTSALLKLVKDDEAEATALRTYIEETTEPQLVSSALLVVEARRGMHRLRPDGLPKVDLLLAEVAQIEISGAVIESASRLPDPLLRSLDAIHLATALSLGERCGAFFAYDERLICAAREHGLTVTVPRP